MSETATATPEFQPTSMGTARARFAAFPDPLKQALRIAAKRNGWDDETWLYQIGLLGEAMIAGYTTAEELAAAYLQILPARNDGASRGEPS